VAIVTGAGSGIGRAVCQVLWHSGYRLALVGRTKSSLTETSDLLNANEKAGLLILPADVGEPAHTSRIIEPTHQKWGRIDALINNAATLEVRPIEQNDDRLLEHTFRTNVFGPARLIAKAWPIFISQRRGCVVNVSSIATVDPFPGLSAYAASKAALECLTRSILVEGRQHGIRGFAVAPGAVETAMLRQVVSEENLPTEYTLDPMAVASVIGECVTGIRDAEIGKTIYLPKA
jgi:NAD(P)-dependent dehydrogenase (short-subunit alcohol dehydrogenase family)